MAITRNDLKDIDNNRPDGEGFSISENDEYRDVVEGEFKRLSGALELWMAQHGINNYETPLYNSGYRFANDTFICCCYDWSDEPIDVNFYHPESKCDISWYKHAWRGTYGHNKETEEMIKNCGWDLSEVINDCIKSLATTDENQFSWE